MILGYIVSDKDVIFDEQVKTVRSIGEVDASLPVLIIGYNKAKELIGSEFNILEKKYKEHLFWTYSLIENRNDYEIDTELFVQYCHENFISELNYVFADPIQYRLSTIKRLINKIKSMDKVISFQYKDYIYIYGEKLIFGLDLKLYDMFLGISKDNVINKVKQHSEVYLADSWLDNYKDIISRLGSVKYVPYVYFCENFKN